MWLIIVKTSLNFHCHNKNVWQVVITGTPHVNVNLAVMVSLWKQLFKVFCWSGKLGTWSLKDVGLCSRQGGFNERNHRAVFWEVPHKYHNLSLTALNVRSVPLNLLELIMRWIRSRKTAVSWSAAAAAEAQTWSKQCSWERLWGFSVGVASLHACRSCPTRAALLSRIKADVISATLDTDLSQRSVS